MHKTRGCYDESGSRNAAISQPTGRAPSRAQALWATSRGRTIRGRSVLWVLDMSHGTRACDLKAEGRSQEQAHTCTTRNPAGSKRKPHAAAQQRHINPDGTDTKAACNS